MKKTTTKKKKADPKLGELIKIYGLWWVYIKSMNFFSRFTNLDQSYISYLLNKSNGLEWFC